jgi:hypothetical protein
MQVAINIILGEGDTLFGAVKTLLGMPDDAEVVAYTGEGATPETATGPKRRGRKPAQVVSEANEPAKDILSEAIEKAAVDVVENVKKSNVVQLDRKVTFDDVRQVTVRLCEAVSKAAAEKLRDSYGVKKINDIPEVEWFGFIQKAEQLIANKETEVA